MKKRMAALVMCAVLTCTLIAAPRARAVVVEATAAALGVSIVSAYMSAIGLGIGADSGDTVTSGLNSLVSDFLTDTGSTETAQSWFEYIAGFASMPVAGSLKLPASVVKTIGFFVDWLTEKFGLDEAGDTAVAVPGISDIYSYNGIELRDIESVWTDKVTYPHAVIIQQNWDSVFKLWISSTVPFINSYDNIAVHTPSSAYAVDYVYKDGNWIKNLESSSISCGLAAHTIIWSNSDIYKNTDNSLFFSLSSSVPAGDIAGQVGLTREDNFANVANDLTEDSDKELNIVFPETITNLDDLATAVPDQIAAGTLAPTYELTGTGEGTDTEDGTTVGLLQSILQGVKAIPDAFTNSLTDVFTPSQEAVDSLATTVNTKLPLIGTLQDFGGDISYYLQHPEECANGLSLTTVVDLGKGRGTYLGDSQQDILDVSWYLEYKSMVDDIIVGFAWLIFLWNCYGALPRILHGEGTIAESIEVIKDGDGK